MLHGASDSVVARRLREQVSVLLVESGGSSLLSCRGLGSRLGRGSRSLLRGNDSGLLSTRLADAGATQRGRAEQERVVESRREGAHEHDPHP